MAIGRYVKFTARAGQGDALASALLQVAEGLREAPGCGLYVVNRAAAEPDIVWVNEIWRGEEQADAALETEAARAKLPGIMALLEGEPERTDVEPLGGVGYLSGGTGFTVVNLDDVKDQAPGSGAGEAAEARFARKDLGALRTGVSLQRVRPDRRHPFAHRHHHAEEVYVVLSGSGRVKVDDEIREIGPLDAIRIAPESIRGFEAGPDGLELLAVGAHHVGDGELAPDFWTD